MAASDITIKGAREHNLRDVDLVLPRNRLICFTGVSGSGKSSLAFDTLYAEGQRRYVESLSSYARQFLGQMPKPQVDLIEGLSPAISIAQKSTGQSPRSTVGTITEIHDFLRVLYARVGRGHCPRCGRELSAQTREQILQQILALPERSIILILSPLARGQKGEFRDLFADLRKQGFARARVDGRVVRLSEELNLDRQMRHDIEVLIDRLTISPRIAGRLAEALELALKRGEGNLIVAGEEGGPELSLSAHYACTHCQLSFEPPSPQMFSFNSPRGMCPACDGLGEIYGFDPERLVVDPAKSFQQGCIELVGRWRQMGRWRRHIFRGVAETLEREYGLAEGTVLETAWEELDQRVRHDLLFGTGQRHITYTWRAGSSGRKWGGHYEGIIPKLLSQYRNTRSRLQRRALEKYMRVIPCGECRGERLNPQARAVTLTTASDAFRDAPARSLPEVCRLPVTAAKAFFGELELDAAGRVIAEDALKEIRGRLEFLADVGLDYLALERTAPTLSGGEMQRIRLAGQIGCGLVGVLYILDEPSIGLHARDNDRLLATLARLRDQGNTVVVVEHDEETMRAADHVVDFGPGPGVRGGRVVAAGPADELARHPESLTGEYLSGRRQIAIPSRRRPATGPKLVVRGATHNNLKEIDVEIPLGALVCITGVSGSGKSSLASDILVEALRRDLNGGLGQPGAHRAIEGLEHLDKMIAIDQSPIGRTPRSNPGTYIKVFDEIRNLYSQLPLSKTRGYAPGRFSFNVAGGRCDACEGNGSTRLEMDFLADIWVTCPVCKGHRFNRETLQVQFKGRSIAQVLEMDIQEALAHFENLPKIRHKLQTLHDVGLDYMKLGQPSPTLSGGEAQRIKLARELVKRSTGRTLYLLDEPTTGLHFADIELLLRVLDGFVAAGNTVVVVEHNLEVIKTADWIIDLGPEGGEAGGWIVAAGTPEEVARVRESHTGAVLRGVLDGAAPRAHPPHVAHKPAGRQKPIEAIRVRGARQHNLKGIDVDIPRDRMTVCCGVSGSGKTSLAMDTVYAEGQRRYVESLSAYARQFIGQMQKPKLDRIDGLSPAVAIEQKHAGHTPRSTVGTITEIHDYLRILVARLGEPYCPDCDAPIGTQSADEVIGKIMALPAGTRLYLVAPVEIPVGGRYETLLEELRTSGYVRVRVDGQTYPIDQVPAIDRRRRHAVEVVVDRLTVEHDARGRIADSVENALSLGGGVLRAAHVRDDRPEPDWPVDTHSQHFACDRCGRSFEPLAPHHFSFNSPLGWCPACEGLGTQLGANPAALLHDAKKTLAEGAIDLWPRTDSRLFALMLDAFSRGSGVPIDVPYEQLGARHRRAILHGTREQWFQVFDPRSAGVSPAKRSASVSPASSSSSSAGETPALRTPAPLLRFQYKGLYPALAEAERLSPRLRGRLEHLVDEVECSECGGSRLRDDAAAVRLCGQSIDELCRKPLGGLLAWFDAWRPDEVQRQIAGDLIREITNRLGFLVDVGLEYLTLGRPAATLSGGEMQRIRLAAQVGSGLCGVLYVLDEPTIGLHPRDNRRLIAALRKLRNLGNTLLLVEHDREVIRGADRLLDFGPGAGRLGGQIVAQGSPEEITRRRGSVTGPYLSGSRAIAVPTNRRMTSADSPPPGGGWLEVLGARHHNLKSIDVRIPLGTLTVVTGPSGSGKSSLVDDILHAELARTLHRAKGFAGAHDGLRGVERISKVIRVNQQPLGQTPTSSAATFTGVFDLIRALFAQLPEARLRGYTARRFSFNVPGGRCEKCEGNGQLKIEMHFLPDVWIECDACGGKRYDRQTLEVTYHGHSIADVLEMPCGEALRLFANIPKIRRILQTLVDVGLDYLALGQPAPTLSGGEAQRVKLAAELARPEGGNTLYLLDEPTTGLHFDDLAKLLDVLNRLVDLGNTVVVIEHNLDVIKTADWVIDLGPEAGDEGGYVTAAGTPEQVVAHAARALSASALAKPPKKRKKAAARPKGGPSGSDAPPVILSAAKDLVGESGEIPRCARNDARAANDALRCHTGEALAPVLAAGPHEPRAAHDFARDERRRRGDLDLAEVGSQTRMPWEVDGPRWHARDRVGHNGRPCRWDGRVLTEVVQRIERSNLFGPTDWSTRTVVEIRPEKKSLGWFFHALTAEEWLLKMKFRIARGTFRRDDLVAGLDLKPLNDMPDLPLYGTQPRVRCRNLRGPWQEVELRVHDYSEIDRPAFWEFLDRAVEGFRRFAQHAGKKPEDLTPWKVLGRKWHLLRKGFPTGKTPRWEPDLLERVLALLEAAAPAGEFVWGAKQIVHLVVPDVPSPWASVQTKKLDAVHLLLHGPRGRFPLGRIKDIGRQAEVLPEPDGRDTLRLRLATAADLAQAGLKALLAEHLRACREDRA